VTALPTITALMRGLHLAAALSLLGGAGFSAWILPAARIVPDRLRLVLSRLRWISGLLALLAGAAWFTLQAATIAGADTLPDAWDALPAVAEHTRYGNMLMLRLGLLLVATLLELLTRRGLYPAIALTAMALATQGLIGHAGAAPGMTGNELLLSEALHLIAAGIWFGALLPLWLSLRALSTADAAAVCLRFSPLGLACVLILAGTGFAQGLALIGSIPALFGTTYGHISLLKIALFLLALALAAINRLWLTDRLAAAATDARRHLMASALAEALIGLAIVTAAAFLASTVPGVHQQPVWPFPWQFTLVTVREDADFRQEVFASLVLVGVAVLMMAAALLWRRLRIPALVVLLAAVAWRGPSFTLLTAEAYPTSFQTSPTGFSAESIARGQALFAQRCIACHGPDGEGNGPAAAALRIKPADLTQPHVWGHSDGEMFWWLTHGIDDPEGGLAMPGFRDLVPPEGRWALIDYVRAHSAAVAFQQNGTFDTPVPAPAGPIACNGLPASALADLHGRAVLVVLGASEPDQDTVPPAEAVTLTVPADDSAAFNPTPGSCVAASPAAWNAYAILADLPLDEAAGTAFLIDPNGWLRAVRRPGATGAWRSPDDLLAAIRGIRTHPIEQRSGASHEHHH
jgi:putative copper export protein/mono/diheme cytochrome c family protein